jgi:tetratricopeptide (TPR) repeat protein
MYTLIIGAVSGAILGSLAFIFTESVMLSSVVGVGTIVAFNVLVGRYFMKKLTVLMASVEKDLKAERIEPALEKLKGGYKYARWQLFVKSQIDSQIGSVLYLRKRFDEALPYLEKSFSRNWSAMAMLAAHHYRNKNYEKTFKVMEKAIQNNKKEPFLYSLYAYFLSEQGNNHKAILVLNRASEKFPTDERIDGALDSLKNSKKVKIQNYGPLWMQLHLGKSQDGAKPYQALIANQKIKRR